MPQKNRDDQRPGNNRNSNGTANTENGGPRVPREQVNKHFNIIYTHSFQLFNSVTPQQYVGRQGRRDERRRQTDDESSVLDSHDVSSADRGMSFYV